MNIKRILLAEDVPYDVDSDSFDFTKVQFPLYASPKLDGIRVLHHPHYGVCTRKLKPLPNNYVREMLSMILPVGKDGEVLTYDQRGYPRDFNDIQSDLMSRSGTPFFKHFVFDDFLVPNTPFYQRLNHIRDLSNRRGDLSPKVEILEQHWVTCMEELTELNERFIEQGFEGTMIRNPEGIYKEGRSTLNQGILLKLKKFYDGEGIVVGFEELMTNNNPQELDELGYAKRSSHKEGKEGAGILGSLILDTEWGELRVGSGFDHATRQLIWEAQEAYKGRIVVFKYQKSGMKSKPRFPIFKGFRDPLDLSA